MYTGDQIYNKMRNLLIVCVIIATLMVLLPRLFLHFLSLVGE